MTTRLNGYLETVNTAKGLFQQGRNWWQVRTRWSVSIYDTDDLYPAAMRWFTDAVHDAGEPPRAVEARTVKTPRDSAGQQDAELHVLFDESAPRTVTIGGHRVLVQVNGTGSPQTGFDEPIKQVRTLDLSSYMEPDSLRFFASSREGQQAVLAMLDKLTTSRNQKPSLWLMTRWGDWNRRDDLPARSLDSVVLAEGQMERLRDDLERFLGAEAAYNQRGIPWHRGYLLDGPAGTGKTSVIRALASHFGMDIWYAPLGDISEDVKLLNLIAQVRPRSILLLEDFDSYRAARDRDGDSEKNVSTAGILNALDGVSTPHGLISFLTSNRPDVIDPALLRPGRVDLREHIGLPDPEQVARLFCHFYSTVKAPAGLWREGQTTAGYVETFKRHMADPAGAVAELQPRSLNGSKREFLVPR